MRQPVLASIRIKLMHSRRAEVCRTYTCAIFFIFECSFFDRFHLYYTVRYGSNLTMSMSSYYRLTDIRLYALAYPVSAAVLSPLKARKSLALNYATWWLWKVVSATLVINKSFQMNAVSGVSFNSYVFYSRCILIYYVWGNIFRQTWA